MSEETELIGDDLTPKQKAFCEEYLVDLNITQAAIRAGYSPNTASEQGSRLLGKVKAMQYIQSLIDKRSERTEIDQDWVLQQLKDFYKTSSQRVAAIVYDNESKSYEQQLDQHGNPVFKVVDPLGTSKSIEMMLKHTGGFEKNNTQKQPIQQIIVTKRIIEKGDKRD